MRTQPYLRFFLFSLQVVGVRNDAGDKGAEVSQTLVVDEDDEIRNEIGIPKDFFVLGGRETYVLNKKGEVGEIGRGEWSPLCRFAHHCSLTTSQRTRLQQSVQCRQACRVVPQ